MKLKKNQNPYKKNKKKIKKQPKSKAKTQYDAPYDAPSPLIEELGLAEELDKIRTKK